MKQKRIILNIIITAILAIIFILGLYVIFSASSNAANLLSRGSIRDGDEWSYVRLFRRYTIRGVIIGTIPLLIGVIGLIINARILYKKVKNNGGWGIITFWNRYEIYIGFKIKEFNRVNDVLIKYKIKYICRKLKKGDFKYDRDFDMNEDYINIQCIYIYKKDAEKVNELLKLNK